MQIGFWSLRDETLPGAIRNCVTVATTGNLARRFYVQAHAWLVARRPRALQNQLTPAARMTMWSLTLPQVAATLAATLVAFDTRNPAGQRLVDNRLLNVVLQYDFTAHVEGVQRPIRLEGDIHLAVQARLIQILDDFLNQFARNFRELRDTLKKQDFDNPW